jgi:perosamine synthetase
MVSRAYRLTPIFPEVRIPLAKPPLPLSVSEDLRQVIESGRLVCGPHAMEFEELTAQRVGVDHAVSAASGTLAAWILLHALDIPAGAKVAVPAFTFIGVANAVFCAGGVPVPIDICSHDLAMNPQLLEEAAADGELWGVMVVDPFGFAIDFEPYEKVCAKYGLVLMEDAACALGSVSAKNMNTGSRGAGAIFSFHPRKVVTSGEGGMITTSDPKLGDQLRKLVNHGKCSQTGAFIEPGFNARLSELSAVCGKASILQLDEEIRGRQICLEEYERCLKGEIDAGLIRLVLQPENTQWNVQTLVMELLLSPKSCGEIQGSARTQGIELGGTAQAWAGTEAYPMHSKSNYPVSVQMEKRTLSLPMYNGLELHQVQSVCAVLSEALLKPNPSTETLKPMCP